MHGESFDQLARTLATGSPRRTLLKALTLGVVGMVLGGHGGKRALAANGKNAGHWGEPDTHDGVPFRVPQCAGAPCNADSDCSSQFCQFGDQHEPTSPDDPRGHAVRRGGRCAPVSAGGPCRCGGDCTSQFCNVNVCAPVCASPNSRCAAPKDCTNRNCVGGHCLPIRDGGPCSCGGDCINQFCNCPGIGSCTAPGVCGGVSTCGAGTIPTNGGCAPTCTGFGAPCPCPNYFCSTVMGGSFVCLTYGGSFNFCATSTDCPPGEACGTFGQCLTFCPGGA